MPGPRPSPCSTAGPRSRSSSWIAMERSSAVPDSERILILGGTGEARALADALAQRPGIQVITSLAGRTVAPRLPKGESRVGGFGGGTGLAAYIAEQSVDA